jgi:LCP family protein required for cell wall assembly
MTQSASVKQDNMGEGTTRRNPNSTQPGATKANRRPKVKRASVLRRIPSTGPVGTVFGIGGMLFGTLMLGLLVAVVLRAALTGDAFNPFREEGSHAFLQPTATPNATPNPEFLAPTIAPFQGTDRVTVLVMGADTRPDQQGYRNRTDTIMVMMADPVNKQAGILSIPRDLYVDIPGYGLNRINTAYLYGGGDLAVQTVEYNIGVRIDYYVVVEFEAFTTLVDEIGGIDVFVPREIYDPSFPDDSYGYDPFYMPAGMQHMDGVTALHYARTRHADNDYERARRQQAVVLAVREKVLSLDMLPRLIQRAPTLYATVSDSVTTDMTLEEMINLASLAQEIPAENIRNGVIDSNYVVGYTTEQGSQVLIPSRARISELLADVFWLE